MAKQAKDINLNDLSLEELKILQKDVAKAVDSFEERRRKDALVSLESKARELGFSLSELVGGKKKSEKSAAPAKYQNPADPTLTWTGRGRQPGWIKEGLQSGKSLEHFLIS